MTEKEQIEEKMRVRSQFRNSNESVTAQIWSYLLVTIELLVFIAKLLIAPIEEVFRLLKPGRAFLEPISGKIVLITGTGHGIGKELALLYASEGATVVAWDLNEKNNNETIDEIERRGFPKAYSYICDVSNRKEVFEIARKVQDEVGHVSILINNAGIMMSHVLEEYTQEEIERIFRVNVFGHFWTIQAFLPAMKSAKDGHIVAVSSAAGILALENSIPYSASKFAVRGVMEGLFEELRLYGNSKLKLTTVYPYFTRTGLCGTSIRFERLMRVLEPREVAEAIMNAQRTNVKETTLPKNLMYLSNYIRLFPDKCAHNLRDFLDCRVPPD